MKKIDIKLGVVVGFIVGFFAQMIANNLGFVSGAGIRLAIIVAMMGAVPLGLFIASLIGKKFPVFWRIGKFVATGALNTAIDWGILNFLSVAFNVYSGNPVRIFNTIAFGVAVTNSYFWNKFWVFAEGASKKKESPQGREFVKFLVVSVIGLLLNNETVYLFTTVIGPIDAISPDTWELVSKIPATVISLFWNFIGYKLIVFRVKEKNIR